MQPKGKNIWITGASSGIGRALSLELAKAGGRVLLSARRPDRLEEAAAACRSFGSEAMAMPLDLSRTGELAAAAAEAETRLGGIDMLVHSAGIGQRGLALDTANEVAQKIFAVNFWGAVELTRALAPAMARRASGQVVFITSVLGKFGAPRRSMYAAAKHALHGWCDSLREELWQAGVEITLIVPGWVRTELSDRALEADGSAHGGMDVGQQNGLTPEVFAERAMPAIVKGVPEQLVGGIECGGVYLNRLWPGLFRKLLRRKGIG